MKYICSSQTPVTNRTGTKILTSKVLYVSELRGHGGVDWGYSPDRNEALRMSERMAKIFLNEGPKYRRIEPA